MPVIVKGFGIFKMQIKRLVMKQLPKLSKTEIGWITGFFEGEDSAGCYRRSERKNNQYFLTVKISQRDSSPLIWLQQKLGFGSLTRGRGGFANNLIWTWNATSNNARVFLNLVLPYMTSNYKIKQVTKALKIDKKYVHRGNKGERHIMAKLNKHEVKIIKRLLALGKTQTGIAKTYNVSKSLINHIATGRLWRNT